MMEIEYRPATKADLELILAWRSNPELYDDFIEQDGPLVWEDHVDWWCSRDNRRDWIIVVRDSSEWRDVGSVNVSDLDSSIPQVGVYVGEVTLWGTGIATKAVEFAVDWIFKKDYEMARANILSHNDASKRVFERVGFKSEGENDDGICEYRLSRCESYS